MASVIQSKMKMSWRLNQVGGNEEHEEYTDFETIF